MKKKVLSMLLAICLVIGLLPMTALIGNAAQATRSVYIFKTEYKVTATNPIVYGTIDPDTGKPSAPTTTEPADWNIKFGYEDANATVPTLTLKNATLGKAYKLPDKDTKFNQDQYGFVYDPSDVSNLDNGAMITDRSGDSYQLNIVAIGQNTIYSHAQGILARLGGLNLTTDASSSLTIISRKSALRDDTGAAASGKAITLNGNFTFQTVHAKKFTMDGTTPVFDGTNAANVDGYPIYTQSEDVVIAGGNINLYANADYTASAIYSSKANFKMTGGNLFVEARAAVKADAGTVIMEGGNFVFKSTMCDANHRKAATAIVAGADGKFVIKGGEVLMYESTNRYGGLFSYFSKWDSTQTNGMETVMGTSTIVTNIDLTQYNGAYTAIGSTDNSADGIAPANSTTKTWTATDADLNSHLCYFHVAPHTHSNTTQKDATHHWTVCGTCGEEGTKVEHTYPATWTEGKKICTEPSCAWELVCTHTYDGDQDADCNICGLGRNVHTHAYNTPMKDDTHHWAKCECGESNTKVEHTYGAWSNGKRVCSEPTCGHEQTCTHTWDNDQDTTCNVCGTTRTVQPTTPTQANRTIYIFGTAYTAGAGVTSYGTIDSATGKPSAPTTTEPQNWNIKFGYADANATVPTLTLKNATLGKAYKAPTKDTKFNLDQYGFVYDATVGKPTDLKEAGMITDISGDTCQLNIVAVGANTIYSHAQGIVARLGGLNLTTDTESSLTIIARRAALRDDTGNTASGKAFTLNGNFTFQTVHAMKFTMNGETPSFDGTIAKNAADTPIYTQSEDVVIAGGNINISANADHIGSAIYTSAANFKMTGGKLFMETRAAVNAPKGTVVMEGGNFVLKSIMCDANHRKAATAIVAGADGKFVIKGGEVLMYESRSNYGGLFSKFSKWNTGATNAMETTMGTDTIVTLPDLSGYTGSYIATASHNTTGNGNPPAAVVTYDPTNADLMGHLCYFSVKAGTGTGEGGNTGSGEGGNTGSGEGTGTGGNTGSGEGGSTTTPVVQADRTIYIFGTAYTAGAGVTSYGTIDANGKPSAPSTTEIENWNIKFGYEKATDETPTLTLKNATLGKVYTNGDTDKFGMTMYGFAYSTTNYAAGSTSKLADLDSDSMITDRSGDAYKLNIVAVGKNFIYSHGQGIVARLGGLDLSTDASSSLTIISNRSALRDDSGNTNTNNAFTLRGNITLGVVHDYTCTVNGDKVTFAGDSDRKKNISGYPIYTQSEDVVIAAGNIKLFANPDWVTTGIYSSAADFLMTGGKLLIECRNAIDARAGEATVEGGKLILASNSWNSNHRMYTDKSTQSVVDTKSGKFMIKGGSVEMYVIKDTYNTLFAAFAGSGKDPTLGKTLPDVSQYNGKCEVIGGDMEYGEVSYTETYDPEYAYSYRYFAVKGANFDTEDGGLGGDNEGGTTGGTTGGNGGTTGGNPNTGDYSMITLWVTLLALSAVGFVSTLIIKKKVA